ncbi:MAG: AbrB/MazE/SpoVT family DNA-binding domain-containing protein [Acidobacteriota bacterium]
MISKVGRRGLITLPRVIRKELRLREGDHIAFVPHGGAVIVKALNRTLLDLRGSIPVTDPQDFDAIRRQVKTMRSDRGRFK